jgi:hypothetical protein
MKIVIGVLRDSSNEINSYIEKGYHVEYLDDHAKKIATKLIANREFTTEEIQRVKESGYKVSSRFWVNLALTSAKDYDKILIADLQEEDNKKSFSKVI